MSRLSLTIRRQLGRARLRVCQLLGKTPFEPGSLLETQGSPSARLTHVAYYTDANAGDTLLPACVRDAIAWPDTPIRWTSLPVQFRIGRRELQRINGSDGLIIGGGGLLIRDSNPRSVSGWQWDCPLDALDRIRVPTAVFAVGYNRFRGQGDFAKVFAKHVSRLIAKSVFFGLRNRGSVRSLRGHLPAELHERVEFQPCPTVLAATLYPDLFREFPDATEGYVALNCAFDRSALRFGRRQKEILREIANAARRIGQLAPLRYVSHTVSDRIMLDYLRRAGVDFREMRLDRAPPSEILRAYAGCRLAIGMRGHAQLIPFGCGRPILSLISHDKLRWFLDDIDAGDWGLEVDQPDLADLLTDKVSRMLSDAGGLAETVREKQQRLWQVTRTNVRRIRRGMGLTSSPDTETHHGRRQ